MKSELRIGSGGFVVRVTEVQTGKVWEFGPFSHDDAQRLLYDHDTLRKWIRNGRP